MADQITAQEFYDQCEKHDWYFDWSDDGRVYRAGSAERNRLKGLAAQSPELNEIWDKWNKHMFSGDPWKTEKQAKPERPVEASQ